MEHKKLSARIEYLNHYGLVKGSWNMAQDRDGELHACLNNGPSKLIFTDDHITKLFELTVKYREAKTAAVKHNKLFREAEIAIDEFLDDLHGGFLHRTKEILGELG